MSDRIIIIGAGIGGMSAAIHMTVAGYEVLVLEKNPSVGGKMAQIEESSYRWDTGPSVITMRDVFEGLFSAAGRRLEDYLTLERVDPLTRYFYPAGTILNASLDPDEMTRQIEAIDPRDVDGYARFLTYVSRLHDLVSPLFIYDHPPKLSRLLKVSPFEALRFDGLRTMHQAISNYVQSSQLQQLLGRFATYVGASPYQAPATLNVIAHVELNGGVWYPDGGIYRIAEAYARLAGELGVTIQTGCTVAEIVTSGGRVEGVRLEV
jgi:phytoene desaturase